MNDQQSFEREVATWIAAEGTDTAPDQTLDDILTATSRKRPLPGWLALIKEPPMRISNSIAVGSPMVRIAAIMVATLLLTIMVAGAGLAGSRILAADGPIIVDPNGTGDTTTINEAVAIAEDGDEILVLSGIYKESVTITKDITLRGEDRDSVIVVVGDTCRYDFETEVAVCPEGTPLLEPFDPYVGEPQTFGILVDGADAEISDLTVRPKVEDVYGYVVVGGAPKFRNVDSDVTVVAVLGGSAAEFTDSVFRGPVFIEGQSPARLVGNQFTEFLDVNTGTDRFASEDWDLAPDEPMPIGGAEAEIRDNELVTISFAGPVTVAGNIFVYGDNEDDSFAIVVEDGEGWSISDNTISGYPRFGIRQKGGSGGDVVGNTLIDNSAGMSVITGPDSRVASNRVEGGLTGIRVKGSGVVEDNEVRGAERLGLIIDDDATVTVTGNTSCDNGVNLSVAESASPTIDDTNTFCDQVSADG
jgi:hypothetical protein